MDTGLLTRVDRRLGLSKLFDGRIYTLADVNFRSKPNPDIFLYAAQRLKSKPENCLVIEDAPYGIRAAKRAGMQCLAITTTYPEEKLQEADIIIDNYSSGCAAIKACEVAERFPGSGGKIFQRQVFDGPGQFAESFCQNCQHVR